MSECKTILWWGRFDPDYSRNRILRRLLKEAGHRLVDFRPRVSLTGFIEAQISRVEVVDVVWVGAFRQKDFYAARKFARRHRIPLIFDPLISAWDKQVFERQKFPPTSWRAGRLKRWEQEMFSAADLVLADTELHARFFVDELGADEKRTVVVPVGAEEGLFVEQPRHVPGEMMEILFYGSFIELQAPETIVMAAREVPEARWTLLGEGPLKARCRELAKGCDHISFEPWCPYERLAGRIGQADILLGVFGESEKAGRVIPNKAYQALACGRPLVTRESLAYPEPLRNAGQSGILFIPPGRPEKLAQAVHALLADSETLHKRGQWARKSYESWFSEEQISRRLLTAVAHCLMSR